MKFKKSILFLTTIVLSVFLSSCATTIPLAYLNKTDHIDSGLEVYYSEDVNVVCFTTLLGFQDNISCLPGSEVNTAILLDKRWNVI